MKTTTPNLFAPNFIKDLIPWLLKQIDEAKAHGFRVAWDMGWQIFAQHWLSISSTLLLVLCLSTTIAFTTGHWGWFGSVLYNYLYFSVMIVIGFICGPEVFANDYFEIVLAVTYVVCFLCVGWIVTSTGLRPSYR